MHNSILIVAAHPDDEVLGCGGAIASYAAQGVQVQVIFKDKGAIAVGCFNVVSS